MIDKNFSLKNLAIQADQLAQLLMNGATASLYDLTLASTLREAFVRFCIEKLTADLSATVPDGRLQEAILAKLTAPIEKPRFIFETGACFVAGTLVHTKEGLVPIEQIQVGDWVLSKPESGEGELAYKQVTKTFRYEDGEVWVIDYVEKDVRDQKVGPGRTVDYEDIARIIVTPNHPFWVKDKGWVQAKDIKPFDELEMENGRLALIFKAVPLYRDHPNRNMAWEPAGDSIMCETGNLIDLSYNQFNEFRSKDDPKWQRGFLDEDMENPAFYFRTTVYNFAVEDFHTYFVGTKGVWVHSKTSVKA